MDKFVQWLADGGLRGRPHDGHVPHPYLVVGAIILGGILISAYKSWRAKQPRPKDLRGDRAPPPDNGH